jgi:glycogen debranching enzyme
MLLGEYERWTGDRALVEQLAPALDAALQWMGQDGDPDRDGFIEYARRSAKGLANQGWKDSGEGIVNRDGSLPRPPIALVEVQGYAYAAYLAGADLLELLGRAVDAGRLRERAGGLRDRFEQRFWMEADRYYALGLDGRKEHITAITSNPGHALWTGIASRERAGLVADRLLSPALFSGWGIRTLAEDMAAYNPLGYHLGTIWPHDNALIVAGLMRYGFPDYARRIATSLFDAARTFRYYRLPELFCGIPRTEHSAPIGYPVACSPQAWAAGSLPFMLQALLGLRPESGGRSLLVDRPALPAWLREVRVTGLRVGSGRVDLIARRDGQRTTVEVSAVDGDIAVDVRLDS